MSERRKWPCSVIGRAPAPPVLLLQKPPPPLSGSSFAAALCHDSDSLALALAPFLTLESHVALSVSCRRARGALWSQAAWRARLQADYPDASGGGDASRWGAVEYVAMDLHNFLETYRDRHRGARQEACHDDGLLSLLPLSPPARSAPRSAASPAPTPTWPPFSPARRCSGSATPAVSPQLSPRSAPEDPLQQSGTQLLARLGEMDAEIANLDSCRAAMEEERMLNDLALESVAGEHLRRDAAKEQAMRAALTAHFTSSALQRMCPHKRVQYACERTEGRFGERWAVTCKQCGCGGQLRLTERSDGADFVATIAVPSPRALGPLVAPPPSNPPRQRSGPRDRKQGAAALRRTMPPQATASPAPRAAFSSTVGPERRGWGGRPLPPLKGGPSDAAWQHRAAAVSIPGSAAPAMCASPPRLCASPGDALRPL
eukprot:TRINITY_DN26725_c0_g1_i2.p1 TRINITY_DN26725_c0_g1~~TRINITY_DN26725_c0_g1_i2.p1  ORF type:complete len:430 (+),score=133.02 TRINITY_DN26725_c0_g1_i2:300-1589(+)